MSEVVQAIRYGAVDPLAKPWGYSTRVYCNEQLQVERIFIRPGGFSSVHMHSCKVNQFVVNKGILLVNLFDDQLRPVESHSLDAGESWVVGVGEKHQFVACSLVEGYEFYWPEKDVELDPNDIVRYTTNGVDEAWTAMRGKTAFPYCCVCNEQYEAGDMVVVCIENALRDMCRDCVQQTATEPYFGKDTAA